MNDDASRPRRKLLTHTLAGVSAIPFVSVPGLLAAAPDKPSTHGTWSLPTGGPRDFDFLVGTWKSATGFASVTRAATRSGLRVVRRVLEDSVGAPRKA
ncbi:hypothetical protein LXT21_35140 [Myxococcus sp. K38C18041901]|uniref:hypothetical protein n=1 Tax=Myxococcus guangdongensis TaxID=2906760 RepID=UPI0020A78016|nr:hypothetical protein [Myxococcus guangdongensis]MCP3064025.1 hypothetical protein [Myxococcus guangdongensis]